MCHLHSEFSKKTISFKVGIVGDAKLYDKEIIPFQSPVVDPISWVPQKANIQKPTAKQK
jgi:hypothetical protein